MLAPKIQLGMANPNFLLISVIVISFTFGTDDGLLSGIIAGVLMDMQFGEYLAFYVFIYVTIAYLAGVVAKFYFGKIYRIIFWLILVESLMYQIVIYFAFYLLRGRYFIFTYLIDNILPCSIYTTLVSLLIVPLVVKINKKYFEWKDTKEEYFA